MEEFDTATAREFRLHFLDMNRIRIESECTRTQYWWDTFPSLRSMVEDVCQDWQVVRELGGCLSQGELPSPQAVICLMRVDTLPLPITTWEWARTVAVLTGRCIAMSARGQFQAARLRVAARMEAKESRG